LNYCHDSWLGGNSNGKGDWYFAYDGYEIELKEPIESFVGMNLPVSLVQRGFAGRGSGRARVDDGKRKTIVMNATAITYNNKCNNDYQFGSFVEHRDERKGAGMPAGNRPMVSYGRRDAMPIENVEMVKAAWKPEIEKKTSPAQRRWGKDKSSEDERESNVASREESSESEESESEEKPAALGKRNQPDAKPAPQPFQAPKKQVKTLPTPKSTLKQAPAPAPAQTPQPKPSQVRNPTFTQPQGKPQRPAHIFLSTPTQDTQASSQPPAKNPVKKIAQKDDPSSDSETSSDLDSDSPSVKVQKKPLEQALTKKTHPADSNGKA
jgi:hypothetical protein